MVARDDLHLRVEQLLHSVGVVATDDLSGIKFHSEISPERTQFGFEANAGASRAALTNDAQSLVVNIGCLKDALKKWLTDQGRTADAKAMETFIDSNRAVAIVYDLYNSMKHAGIDAKKHPPRSGHLPKLVNLRRVMRLTTGDSPSAVVLMSPQGMQTSGSVRHVLTGDVVDETSGQKLGAFDVLCADAVESWKQLFASHGLLPP